GLTAADYLPNTIIVKFKTSAFTNPKQSSRSALPIPKISVDSVQILSVTKKFPQPAAQTRTLAVSPGNNLGLDRIYEVKFAGDESIEKVINELLKDETLEYAEPAYIYKTSYEPNDPYYGANMQSYLDQVKAWQAWDITHDASGVIIAIVDSGSDLDHPDLAANILINTADP